MLKTFKKDVTKTIVKPVSTSSKKREKPPIVKKHVVSVVTPKVKKIITPKALEKVDLNSDGLGFFDSKITQARTTINSLKVQVREAEFALKQALNAKRAELRLRDKGLPSKRVLSDPSTDDDLLSSI
jgi:hypothetical protein